MIAFAAGLRVWLAGGVTDMRRGMHGLSLQVQQGLGRDPHGGELFVFRGRRGDLIKVLWHRLAQSQANLAARLGGLSCGKVTQRAR